MTVTMRRLSVVVNFGGNDLQDVLSVRGQAAADMGWPTCSVFVTSKPLVGNEEDDLYVDAGAGNNVRRFTGRLRAFRTSAFPKGLEMVSMGTLGYADEWAPDEDIELFDLLGTDSGTDQEIVRAVLDRVVRATYVSGNIGGRGVALGLEAPTAFIWRAGTSAWQYIQQLDRATLYRTYQDAAGVIHRVAMVGHPSGTPAATLSDNDALDNATGNRSTARTRNAVRVTGWDYGNRTSRSGQVANEEGTYGSNDFQGNGSNPTTRYLETFSSPLIESGTDEDGVVDGRDGLNASDIAAEVLADVNKEFVEAQVPTWRDDAIEPGTTILLDMLNRLAIGEPMWVQAYGWEAGDGWTSQYSLSGGGLA